MPKRKRNNKLDRSKTNRTQQDRNMRFGYYLVAFIDILGQRDEIRKMYVPLHDGDEARNEILDQLTATAGKVISVRELIISTLNFIGQPTHIQKNAEPTIAEKIKEVRKPIVKFMMFSDSLVLFMPLSGNKSNVVSNINAVLCAISFATIACHARGIPIRGGVDVGAGINIQESEIYGSALERAYSLESNYASYPRILIGEELKRYLDDAFIIKTSFAGPLEQEDVLASGITKMALSLISKDNDGLLILNYLSNKIYEYSLKSPTVAKENFYMGLTFAEKQYIKFKNEGNIKLASRYGRLVSFYNAHKGIWDPS